LPVGKKDKNIFGNKLIFGRFGLPCLPAGRRLRSSVPISKENKATSVIADTHNIFSKTIHYKVLQRIFSKITVTRWSNIPFPNRIAELFFALGLISNQADTSFDENILLLFFDR